MKISVTSFELNGLLLSKNDLGLFLQMLGFDVDYNIDDAQFRDKAMSSLREVDELEFVLALNDFTSSDQETRKQYQGIVNMSKIALSPRCLN